MTAAAESTKLVYVSATAVCEFAERLLLAHGIPVSDATLVAHCLVSADLRGVDTHGVLRLPGYLERIRRGLLNPQPEIQIRRVTPVVAAVDGQNGFGFVVATRAMSEAISMARTFGIGIAGVKRSTHFGVAASYVLQAIDAGLVGMVFSNSSSSMPPWGGRTPLFGTSPLAVGSPGGRLIPFVLDMSPAVAARGKIRKAIRRGERIPEGYALDPEGRPTTDPVKAMEGVILPMGGPKGSGISMMMDIFSGVLTGAEYGGGVRDQYKDFDAPQNVGHFLLAMRPDLFVRLDEYRARMDTLMERVHSCPIAEGFSEVLVAGEIEFRQEALRRKRGIPYGAVEMKPLQDEAAKAGIPPLKTLDGICD